MADTRFQSHAPNMMASTADTAADRKQGCQLSVHLHLPALDLGNRPRTRDQHRGHNVRKHHVDARLLYISSCCVGRAQDT
jgi:hypothetical protein